MTTAPEKIIDSCCLLDLYAGWDGLEPLAQFDSKWYVCPATLREVRYIRDIDSEGNSVKVPVALEPSLASKLIGLADTSDEEFDSYMEFASQLGDGEAMSLAIAMHRNWVLATDDRKAAKVAEEAGVETTSTPAIIKAWAELNDVNLGSLHTGLSNIEKRAHFRPPRNSPLFTWWIKHAGI